jgi:hypothetical protein
LRAGTGSVQLGVFGFGLLQDRNVGLGVFPECEEILIGRLGFCGVAFERISSLRRKAREPWASSSLGLEGDGHDGHGAGSTKRERKD